MNFKTVCFNLWSFLKIERWRHHFFAHFEENVKKAIKFPFWRKSKNRLMTSSDSSPMFHWSDYCWKSLDYVWLDLKKTFFDFSKNRLMTSSSLKNEFYSIVEEKCFIIYFFDESWGFLKNRMMTSSDSSRVFHFCLCLEK